MSEYSYQELLENYKSNPTTENLEALAEWFEKYGSQFWNGEEWQADDFIIRPIQEPDDIDGDEVLTWKTVGYEVR